MHDKIMHFSHFLKSETKQSCLYHPSSKSISLISFCQIINIRTKSVFKITVHFCWWVGCVFQCQCVKSGVHLMPILRREMTFSLSICYCHIILLFEMSIHCKKICCTTSSLFSLSILNPYIFKVIKYITLLKKVNIFVWKM